jgi:hypothetical protein
VARKAVTLSFCHVAWTTDKRKRFAKARAEIRQNSESGPLVAEADAMMFLI